eukprot:168488-Amphidinium_carterae.1
MWLQRKPFVCAFVADAHSFAQCGAATLHCPCGAGQDVLCCQEVFAQNVCVCARVRPLQCQQYQVMPILT